MLIGPLVTAGVTWRWNQNQMFSKSMSQPCRGSALTLTSSAWHTFTHNLSFSLLSLISPGFCLGGSRSRTNSLPLSDKRQEVMRWAGRGQLPVSCENSNSFSSETEWTLRRDESDLAVTAVVDLKDRPCLEAWTWIIFSFSTCFSRFLPHFITDGWWLHVFCKSVKMIIHMVVLKKQPKKNSTEASKCTHTLIWQKNFTTKSNH